MATRSFTPTRQIAIRDSSHTPTERDQDPRAPLGLSGVAGMAWIRAKRVAELKVQAIVYAATKNITIATYMPKALRQFLYDMRTRSSLTRDFARFVEVLAHCGATVDRHAAWQHFHALWAAERELATLAFGSPVPEGPTPDHHLTTREEPLASRQGTENPPSGRGVLLGSCDAQGWLESTNGRDWGRAA